MTGSTPDRSPAPARRALGGLALLLAVAAVSTAGTGGQVLLQRGDTLSGLAVRHGVSVQALAYANGITPDATIYAGRMLTLPGSAGPAPSAAPASTATVAHLVRSGENVTVIARRYGSTVASIRTANGLRPDGRIRDGQTLQVPVAAPAAAPAGAPAGAPAAAARPQGPAAASAAAHREQLAARTLPSKAEVRRLVADTARQVGVPVDLALAVAYHESGFQQRVVSPVDAIGVMQVLPRTGAGLHGVAGRPLDLLDTRDNVLAGVLLLRQLLRSTGDENAALAGYYQGLGSIAKKGLLPQTEAYLRSIAVLKPRFAQG